jgi:hypothetical protein
MAQWEALQAEVDEKTQQLSTLAPALARAGSRRAR